MTTLNRYIARTVIVGFLLALAALLAVFSVINLTQELKEAQGGGYGVLRAVWFVLLTLPSEAYQLLPAAALLGTVNGLGALVGHSEVVAMWACGVSRARLIRAVLQAASVFVVGSALLGEFVAAPLAQRARAERSVLISGGRLLSTANGIWARDGSKFVNIRAPHPDGSLGDLYLYDIDDQRRLRSFAYARSASYAEGRWTLTGLLDNEMSDRGVTIRAVATTGWQTSLDPQQLRLLLLPPEDLSVPDLYRSIRSLERRGESPARHQLAFWRRITMPLVAAIMVLLAIPFVLTAPRGVALGQRIVAGALVGVGFQMFNETFGGVGLAYGMAPWLTATLPAAAILAGSLIWLQCTSR
jgi:lipopolysaccharide export system permease protein